VNKFVNRENQVTPKKSVIVAILLIVALPAFASQTFTSTPVCPSEKPLASCETTGVKAAYDEAVRFLKTEKQIEVTADFKKSCGLEAPHQSEREPKYHFLFNSPKAKCGYNVFINCASGKVEPKDLNSYGVVCY
jgi:hypothetical protein